MNRHDNISKKRSKNPVQNASFFSKRTFWWVKDLFRIGFKRPIEEDDIYFTLPNHQSTPISERFTKLWEDEMKQKKPSMVRLFRKAYGANVIGWGLLFSLTESLTRIGQPLSLGGFVTYFAPGQTHATKTDAYWCAFGIIVTSLLPVLIFHPYILYIFEIGMKIRVGSCTLLYKKALRLSKSTAFDGLNGQLINLMTNDVGKFDIALCFIHDLWKGPIEALVLCYFIYCEIGISAVIGMGFMLGFIPLQAWIGKAAASYRLKTAKRTDIRVRFMNEIIQGIQVIKMYAWEKSFAAMVEKVRKKEIDSIKGSAYVRATLLSFSIISRFSIFLSLISYIYFGNIITARKVFIVSSFYSILNLSMVHFWPMAITCCSEAFVSAQRITNFLTASETKPNIAISRKDIADKSKVNDNDNISHLGNCVKLDTLEIHDKKHCSDLSNKYETDNEDEVHELLPRRLEDVFSEHKSVVFKAVSASWSLNENEMNNGIFSIDLKIKENKLCTIVGPVGSGKSTLLQVLIGELSLDDGSVQINGSISYAAQESWLFEGSIRQNIVFIEDFDEKRYYEVIKICALERDLELLPHGDATIVGERGISLSGGQKARVNLARAIYKKADIYILDDPLSAVDTHVGKHIFEKCITNYLANKICILVTHQLQYLKNVEHIVLMNKGRIEAQGSYNEIKTFKSDSMLTLTAEETNNELNKEDKKFQTISAHVKELQQKDDPIEEKETQAIGAVAFDVYKSYFKSVDSLIFIMFVLILFILAQLAMSGTDYFVAQWVNWEETLAITKIKVISNIESNFTDNLFLTNFSSHDTIFLNDHEYENITSTTIAEEDHIREQYVIFYSILVGLLIYLIFHRTFAFFKLCLKVSHKLHDRLFRGITRATMYFFNNNPSGRILNRFSKDIGAIDTELPMALIDCINFFLELFAIMLVVAIVNYWLIIPTVLMSVFFYIIRTIYIKTGRSVKRVESLTRSPIYSHVNATLQGLSTIRAFKGQSVLEIEFNNLLDLNSSAWYMYLVTTRCFAFWLDIVCVIYISITTLSFLVLGNESLSGNVGLAITQVVNLIGMCQWGMRQTAELENQMTSVERVLEYAELPAEPPLETMAKYRPFKGWPDNGKISFNNLSLRYFDTSEFVLKDLNFHIEPREKIGIVGRTGAGKSSIIQALFRLAPFNGSIEIDGIDTKTLGLHELRTKISIIPQDPVLFSGTLRSNLDPFSENKDEDLWHALAAVELKQAASSLAGGLDCKMSDNGSNFSMGQRQLVCLARAILRSNKILILDEATANVDPETDNFIQMTIRDKFENCTVLTIAHRLQTVMDSDRVLVVDAGRIVEFAHPFELIQKPGGYLRSLVDQTGNGTAALLTRMAEENYNMRKQQD